MKKTKVKELILESLSRMQKDLSEFDYDGFLCIKLSGDLASIEMFGFANRTTLLIGLLEKIKHDVLTEENEVVRYDRR